jgi:hypothetical protein
MRRFSKVQDLVSVDDLRRMFLYDPATGELRWRRRSDRNAQWNGHFAGRLAGIDREHGREVTITVGGKRYDVRVGRVCWAIQHGRWPDCEVDFCDSNPHDNRASNIRAATRLQNARNWRVIKGAVGLKGVSRKGRRYRAQINAPDGRHVQLGSFENPITAALVYDRAARRIHGEFAATNAELLETPFQRMLWQYLTAIAGDE